ncbi:Uncharacterized protein Fot_35827 [Forsythia ovata]|uniref:Uncharacterized protein n=1 Tax=Forsythia ovata TaxID=205694 RepID=A0ABD1SMN4_9LAMI
MDSSSASVTSPAMSKESPGNDVEEVALRSKEIIDQSQSSEGEGRVSNFGFIPGGGGGPSFFPGMNSPPRNNFNGSVFNRSQEFFNRAIMNMRYFPQQGAMQHGMIPRYPGCPRPVPGNVNPAPPGIRFSTPGRGTSSSFPRPVPNKNFLEESRNVQMNGPDNQQVEDDSGLDLSLKL